MRGERSEIETSSIDEMDVETSSVFWIWLDIERFLCVDLSVFCSVGYASVCRNGVDVLV